MKLAVIHFQPLEYYPPAINFINFIGRESRNSVTVFTSNNNRNRKVYTNDSVRIIRSPGPSPNTPRWARFFFYVWFTFSSLIRLLKARPDSIFYWESYSALPVYLYMKMIWGKPRLFIHSHEYFPPEWYKKGMWFVKLSHKIEKGYLYRKAQWISHTNEDRIGFFKSDYEFINSSVLKVMPNYPPHRWASDGGLKVNDRRKLKFVFIGSLGFQNSYFREFCQWFKSTDHDALDMYSYNAPKQVEKYFDSIDDPRIHYYKDGIEYDKIPEILADYDVGLILYKAKNKNVVYCAPNKLFEYLTVGLDVWFPEEMKGCHGYITLNTYPKVCNIDFLQLSNVNFEQLIDRSGFDYKPINYSCEEAFAELRNQLLN